MNIREQIEEREALLLSPYAAKSRDAIRDIEEKPDPLRTAFQRDRDRIIHSKCFRRLKHKTQVYIAPGDHYRTRMTHTLEVGQIGRTVARALRLNEDLVEAIAMGHDVGHTPFGHVGEYALRDMVGHFNHNEQSLRMVEVLERHGDHQGLNLTTVVRDGIVGHTGATIPVTLEGQIIRIVDRIAYLCHDFDDAESCGLLTADDLPQEVQERFGRTHSEMITSMVMDLIAHSRTGTTLCMSEEEDRTLLLLRQFMFDNVYIAPVMIPDRERGYHVVTCLYHYFMKHEEKLPEKFIRCADSLSQAVADYISGLTDNRAISLYKDIYVPRNWNY